MLKTRQPTDTRNPHLRTAAVGFSTGYRWRGHRSRWGQLISVSRGMMSVETDGGVWIVPTAQALWLPPGESHTVVMSGQGTLRRVYLRGAPCARLRHRTRVLMISVLLRALLQRVMDMGTLDARRVHEARMLDLLVDEIGSARAGVIDLPLPRDARAVRAAEFVRSDPAGARKIGVVAQVAGASARTLERLFVRDTGMAFGAWRQRARLLHSLTLLSDGDSVTQAALSVGYASTSAYVAAFKSVMGMTPGQYRQSR